MNRGTEIHKPKQQVKFNPELAQTNLQQPVPGVLLSFINVSINVVPMYNILKFSSLAFLNFFFSKESSNSSDTSLDTCTSTEAVEYCNGNLSIPKVVLKPMEVAALLFGKDVCC